MDSFLHGREKGRERERERKKKKEPLMGDLRGQDKSGLQINRLTVWGLEFRAVGCG